MSTETTQKVEKNQYPYYNANRGIKYRKLFDLLREIPADKLDRVKVALELMI